MDEDIPSTSKCGQCEYESDEESDLQEHIKENHESLCKICGIACDGNSNLENHVKKMHPEKLDESESEKVSYLKVSENFGLPFECNTCNLVFATDIKLKKHLCRITVKNPSFCDLYIKNWISVKMCTTIYHRIEKTEIALMHCKDCIEN